MSQKIQIVVDGRPAQVAPDVMLLDALQDLGVHVPTLCHHPSLEPSGACRLCVVEVTHPDWGGWSGLVTSCLYPVEPGLQVSASSERVREMRRTLLELYLARCPDSTVVAALARGEGVDTTPFAPRQDSDLCVHCGLCTRVCQELGPAAIAPLGRGTEKLVGPRPDLVGEDCTGCLCCAEICPTGEIRWTRREDRLAIWNREFPLLLCRVEPEACRGCGICEEACPFAIPRVVATRGGSFVAHISPGTCIGCGVCAGACPTGAIIQDAYPDADLCGQALDRNDLRGRTVVYACSRSPFPPGTEGVIAVPCIGRVSLDEMLVCLARGADGVLVMCRDQATCPYGTGGAQGARRAAVAAELACTAGLGPNRMSYVQPAPGLTGPASALAAYRQALAPSPLKTIHAQEAASVTGLDRALEILTWLRRQPELTPTLPDHLQAILAPACEKSDTALFLGNVPDLDLLLSLLVPDWRLQDILKDTALVLENNGVAVELLASEHELMQSAASRLIILDHTDLPAGADLPGLVSIAELANRPLPSEGPLAGAARPFRFRITPAERQEMIARLRASPAPANCADAHELAQVKLLLRKGSWRQDSFDEPRLAHVVEPPAGTAGGKG